VLCIGIGEYDVLGCLSTAVRDANRKAIQKGIVNFLKEPGLQKAPPATVLVNYSGHGMQKGGHCVYAAR